MDVYGFIYLLIDGTNDKEYVGQTTRSVKVRFKEHTESPHYIGNAMRAHGVELFTWAILKECYSQEELNFWERHMIKSRDTLAPNGYNLTGGGEKSPDCIDSPDLSAKRSASATKAWAKKSPEERSRLAREREARKTPEERSKSGKKSAATRVKNLANRTPEQKAADSKNRSKAMKKFWAEKTQEERDEIRKAKKERIAAKTPEERRQMTKAAVEASKKRTFEEYSAAVKKGRAKKIMKNSRK